MKKSRLPNGRDVFHRVIEVPNALYDEVQAYLSNGVALNEGDCVFDVGANIGVFSLLVLDSIGPTGRAFAFEPIPSTFEVLRRNAELHGDVIRCFNLGISNSNRDVTFHTFTFASGLGSMYAKGDATFRTRIKNMVLDKFDDPDIPEVYRPWPFSWILYVPKPIIAALLTVILPVVLHSRPVQCRLTTISDIMRDHDISRIDLLKIDVEMAELDVLLGIEPEHWRQIRKVAMEVHDIEGRLATVVELLKEKGFDPVHVDQEPLMKGTDMFTVTALCA